MNFYPLAVVFGAISLVAAFLVYCFWPRDIPAKILPEQAITVDESVRQYRLVIPHSLPADSVPIVFAFHGTGDSTEGMAAYSALDRVAVENGFILVYPAARRGMWATVDVDAENLANNPDLRFFDRLLDSLAKRFRIDPNRIYLVGMSNGAIFAQLIAFARPDVAAVAAHSGPMPRGLRDPDHPFPVLLLVGANDFAADAMRSNATEYHNNEHSVDFISISGLGHEWSPRHNAAIWRFLSSHKLGE